MCSITNRFDTNVVVILKQKKLKIVDNNINANK